MQKRASFSPLRNGLGVGVALLQLFDIAIHGITDQLEPLRVFSNILILLWLGLLAVGKLRAKIWTFSVGFVGVYLILNLIFLRLYGLTNPLQGGEPRTMLFGLLFLTTALSLLLIRTQARD